MSLQEHRLCPACGATRPPAADRCPACGAKPSTALAADETLDPGHRPRPIKARASTPETGAASLAPAGKRRRATTGPQPGVAPAHPVPDSHAYTLAARERHAADTVDGLPAGVAEKMKAGSGRPVTIGSCEVLTEIARGGMGVVYKARQVGLNRLVALKVMIAGEAASEAQVKRFLQEARSAARLKHPNIVPIYEVGEEAGRHFFTMEFIEGQALHQLVGGKGMNAAQAVALIEPVAEAVHYAHTQGIIHRDLKPANILIDERGQPRVADFGLARDVSGASSLSQTGHIVGTPAYLSPEQAQGQELDPRSDVYALGVVLYEMLTGKVPFEAPNLMALLGKIAYDDPPPLESHVPTIDVDLKTIVMTCLEKDRQRRYRSAEALAADLKRYRSGEPIAARPASLGYKLKKQLTKHRGVAVGALIALITALGAVGVWWQVEKQRAQAEADKQTEEIKRLKAEADKVQADLQRKAAEAEAEKLQAQNQQLKQQSEKRWETVFTDDFQAAQLGPLWEPRKGTFLIADHQLQGNGRGNRDPEGVVLLNLPLTGDLVVKLRATAKPLHTPELALCAFTTREAPGAAGYFVSFKPDGVRITRENVTLYAGTAAKLTPGTMLDLEFRREGERVRVTAGGAPPIELTDWSAPVDPDRCYVAVYGWNSDLQVERIEVQQAALPEKPDVLDMADFQRARGKPQAALDMVELYLQQVKAGPAREEALRLKAACQEGLRLWPEAQLTWAALAQEYPSEENRFQAAAAQIRAGAEVALTLDTLAAAYPHSDHWLALLPAILGRMFGSRGRVTAPIDAVHTVFAQAQECLERIPGAAAREQGGHVVASTAAALSYMSPTGMDKKEKIWLLELALKLRPGQKEAIQVLLATYEDEKQFLEAAGLVRLQLKDNPDDIHLQMRVAENLREGGDLAGALHAAQRAVELGPRHANAWDLLGTVLFGREQFADALEKFEKAMAVEPDYAPPFLNAASAAFRLGQRERAAGYIRRIGSRLPPEASSHWMAANLLLAIGDEDGAVPYLRAAYKFDPHKEEYRLLLGPILFHQSQNEEALKVMSPETLDPDKQYAYLLACAMGLIELGRYQEAGALSRQVLKPHPDMVQAKTVEAVSVAWTGDKDQALNTLLRIVEHLDAADLQSRAWTQYFLGEVREARGEYPEAIASYEAAGKVLTDPFFEREVPKRVARVKARMGTGKKEPAAAP